jgi:hypothetical protein
VSRHKRARQTVSGRKADGSDETRVGDASLDRSFIHWCAYPRRGDLAWNRLSSEQERDELRYIDDIVATYAAYTDAIERVLGAPSRILYRLDAGTVKEWLDVEDVTTR